MVRIKWQNLADGKKEWLPFFNDIFRIFIFLSYFFKNIENVCLAPFVWSITTSMLLTCEIGIPPHVLSHVMHGKFGLVLFSWDSDFRICTWALEMDIIHVLRFIGGLLLVSISTVGLASPATGLFSSLCWVVQLKTDVVTLCDCGNKKLVIPGYRNHLLQDQVALWINQFLLDASTPTKFSPMLRKSNWM